MRYTWDPGKDALNRRKHGLPLAAGIAALEDSDSCFWFDSRFDYGEERIIPLGLSMGRILYVVSTQIDETLTRIISVRKAEKDEVERYHFGGP